MINEKGAVKLTDFGLSRERNKLATQQVCTMNYRAPELFFGSASYGEAIDIWSAGCTFAEMVRHTIIIIQ